MLYTATFSLLAECYFQNSTHIIHLSNKMSLSYYSHTPFKHHTACYPDVAPNNMLLPSKTMTEMFDLCCLAK
ncbi:hypothetical protein C8Q80DRAFT_1142499 [Daedaleopsis nitida]|nr:hypothetical protein C8Q80DRAFT_1142499 [Daedaleopsis nitida]